MAKNPTDRKKEAGMGITLCPTDNTAFPIAYSDNIWAKVDSNKTPNLVQKVELTSGYYGQDEINEAIAAKLGQGGGGTIDYATDTDIDKLFDEDSVVKFDYTKIVKDGAQHDVNIIWANQSTLSEESFKIYLKYEEPEYVQLINLPSSELTLEVRTVLYFSAPDSVTIGLSYAGDTDLFYQLTIGLSEMKYVWTDLSVAEDTVL